jgi:hypothetical protein
MLAPCQVKPDQTRARKAAAIGGLRLAIGYVTYKATGGIFDIYYWAIREFGGSPHDALFWTIGGAAAGFALAYLQSLNSK